jgi:hypothetical protein
VETGAVEDIDITDACPIPSGRSSNPSGLLQVDAMNGFGELSLSHALNRPYRR